jgi:hypothetical protein
MLLCIAVGVALIATRDRVMHHYETTYRTWRSVSDRMLPLVTRPIAPVMLVFGFVFIAVGIGGLILIALGRTT